MCAMQGGDDECEDGHNGVAATWMKLFARRWNTSLVVSYSDLGRFLAFFFLKSPYLANRF